MCCLLKRAEFRLAIVRAFVEFAAFASLGMGEAVIGGPPAPEDVAGVAELDQQVQAGAGDEVAVAGAGDGVEGVEEWGRDDVGS